MMQHVQRGGSVPRMKGGAAAAGRLMRRSLREGCGAGAKLHQAEARDLADLRARSCRSASRKRFSTSRWFFCDSMSMKSTASGRPVAQPQLARDFFSRLRLVR
jgi:hypothetical protein